MITKSISEIEDRVDKFIEGLEIFKYDKKNTILFLCQLFERRIKEIKRTSNLLYRVTPKFEEGLDIFINIRERIMDEHEALSLLIREVLKNNHSDEKLDILNSKFIFEIGNDAFSRATKYIHAESLFKSMYRGLFSGEVINDKDGEECLRFTYKNEEIFKYEAINAQILNDINIQKRQYIKTPEELGIKRYTKWSFIKIKNHAKQWIDKEIDLPDNYQIGPYKIRQIKEVWTYVITKAYIEYYSNIGKELPTLMELNYKDWSFIYSNIEIVEKLLNDLTYYGEKAKKNTQGENIYSTLLTEPILEISGKKIITPSIILNYQASRNIQSTLNRIYDNSSNDSDNKEGLFVQEIKGNLDSITNIKFTSDIEIKEPFETNVDFSMYDIKTKTLICIELKWLNEPVTAIEILSKDKELQKGVLIQLPNYKAGINKDIDGFMLKAFKEDFTVNEVFLFVVTKGTVGSGVIKRDKYQIINQKMLIKAIFDSNGDLCKAAINLNNGEYFPKENQHYKKVDDININVGDVSILAEGHSILEPYIIPIKY